MCTHIFPKLPESTCILQKNNKFLVLIPEKPDWIIGNKNIFFLLSLCDGKKSISDIYSLVSQHPYREECIKILTTLLQTDFFTDSVQNEDRLSHNLSSLHINMTENCNLKCIYCYAKERTDIHTTLTLQDYYQLIDDAANINTRITITFTGGEPLLNMNTIPLAKYCTMKKLNTFLLTNGTCITEENAECIANTFTNIRISLDGNTEETHDYHRGKGTYRKVMRAISLLENYHHYPMIAMTVTNRNIHEIEPLAARYGNRLTFQPLYPVGRGKTSGLFLDGQTYYTALKQASGVEPYGQIGKKLDALRCHGCTKCALGEGEISISSSGNVYPCHMLHVDKLCAGNIKERSLQDIYYHSPVLHDLRSLSVNTKEGCRECPVRLLCGGGCWARAFYAHGDFSSADDFCDYELSAFTDSLFTQAEFPRRSRNEGKQA